MVGTDESPNLLHLGLVTMTLGDVARQSGGSRGEFRAKPKDSCSHRRVLEFPARFPAMQFYVSLPIISFVSGWLGSFVGAYLKKKGENLATQEDIGKLVKQVEAVTLATKGIEAKISDEVWGRQRVWEMKRDAFFALVRAEANTKKALTDLSSTWTVAKKHSMNDPARNEAAQKATQAWWPVSADFETAAAQVQIVCGPEVKTRVISMTEFLTRTAVSMITAQTAEQAEFSQYSAQFVEEQTALLGAVRDDLAFGR
jgi:hypothetical protein